LCSGQGSDADVQTGKPLTGLIPEPSQNLLLAVAQRCRHGGTGCNQRRVRCPEVGEPDLLCCVALRRKPALEGAVELDQLPCVGQQALRQRRRVFKVRIKTAGVHDALVGDVELMDVIVVSHARGKTWKMRFDLAHFPVWLPMVLVAVSVLALSFAAGYYANGHSGLLPESLMTRWHAEIKAQRLELAEARSSAEQNTRALARRMAELNAQMMRLDAAGERMVKVADLDPREFNFNRPPALGGPETQELADSSVQSDPLLQSIERFESQLSARERQMRVLEDLLMASRMQHAVMPSGWPVLNGFVSSLFGFRTDPFTGRRAFHEGVDFAGAEGSGVIAVGAGLISFAGERSGYGSLVEINHGNGYVTRYGHNRAVLVKAGDTVRKGQRVALMGSSGRSTGPHVHFEVLLNGSPVNPSQFIQASR